MCILKVFFIIFEARNKRIFYLFIYDLEDVIRIFAEDVSKIKKVTVSASNFYKFTKFGN